ncbi:MAG: acyl-CoA dehydrogenase family protein [Hyphomonadaceae bacterium]
MNFDLSEDAKQLAGEARRFLSERAPLSRVRQSIETPGFDEALWRELVALGWLGAGAAEHLGGAGLNHECVCALIEELGAALTPTPAIAAFSALEALALASDTDDQENWSSRIVNGDAIVALAIGDGATAELRNGRVYGVQRLVAYGSAAGAYIVAANEAGDRVLCVVEADAANVKATPVTTLDLLRPFADVRFEGARATSLARGADVLRRVLDRLAILKAFEQLGGARACLDMAVAHVKERRAFGKPIGAFQALKHKLARVFIEVELARSNAYFGAWALCAGQDEAKAAAIARISASAAFALASRETIQVLGALGFTWEADAHLYYRRAQMLAGECGAASHWKQRLLQRTGEAEHGLR